MIGLREDKDRENCHLIKDLNSTKDMLLSLSEFPCVPFPVYFSFQ